jgi:hypothetical protein
MPVRRTRTVLSATVALAALAVSPAAQAIDGFENVGAGYFSPSASGLGISGDGRVVFDNGFVGYFRGRTYANGAHAWAPVLHPGYATIIAGVSYDGSAWAGAADGNPGLHMVRDHRPDGGKGANISGALIDAPFSYTAPGLSSAKGRAEAGGGIRLPAWNNGAVTASATASITPNQTATCVSRLGVVRHVW